MNRTNEENILSKEKKNRFWKILNISMSSKVAEKINNIYIFTTNNKVCAVLHW